MGSAIPSSQREKHADSCRSELAREKRLSRKRISFGNREQARSYIHQIQHDYWWSKVMVASSSKTLAASAYRIFNYGLKGNHGTALVGD